MHSYGASALSAFLLLFGAPHAFAQLSNDFSLKQAWKSVITAPNNVGGGWAEGVGQRYGQTCDPYRQPDTMEWPQEDTVDGCVAVWLSQRGDDFTVDKLPDNQQNNFHNTQHYRQAWNFHNVGFKADSLPQAGVDIDPVCYIANISGQMALGYEEGNGDVLLPCPGARGGYDFPEQSILNASDEELNAMCRACYQAVCTRQSSKNPQRCGGTNEGGVNIENDKVTSLAQVNDAYHCHLTMANDGACDYVQYDQHEESRDYNMSSGVMCGWQNVRYLNLTFCDCTKEAGTANNCRQAECLKMALNGVVCGNCGSCSQSTAYEQIFSQYTGEDGHYDGVCALARTAATPEERAHYTMLCSQGLFCRERSGSNECELHCEMFPDSPVCQTAPPTNRKLLAVAPEDIEIVVVEDGMPALMDEAGAPAKIARVINPGKMRMM